MGTFGGVLAIGGVWVAYKPVEALRIGVGAMAISGAIQTQLTFSASPQDRLLGAPEQPEFDAQAELNVRPFVSPSANAGVTYVPNAYVRIGASGQLPMVIDAPAKLEMQMPSSVVFDGASQGGTSVRMRMAFPAVVRAGIEVRPGAAVRVEATYFANFGRRSGQSTSHP